MTKHKAHTTRLQRSISRMASAREQPKYNRLVRQAYKAATRAAEGGASKGRITPAEKRAIHRAAKATRLVTTRAEAAGTKKVLRRKARRS